MFISKQHSINPHKPVCEGLEFTCNCFTRIKREDRAYTSALLYVAGSHVGPHDSPYTRRELGFDKVFGSVDVTLGGDCD